MYLPHPSAGYDTRGIFKRSTSGLNTEFFFFLTGCLTNAKEFSPTYHLPIGGKINRYIHFPGTLAKSERQTASSTI